MILVFDINTIWRSKPFEALAKQMDVVGVAPGDWLVARHRTPVDFRGEMAVWPVLLPLGWASRMSWLGQRILWSRVMHKARVAGKEIEMLVLTSPHYLPMLNWVPAGIKTIYYASDDYRDYEGWGITAEKEVELIRRVDHSFFVSQRLLDRALQESGVERSRVSVSMNATEPRFFSGNQITAILPELLDTPRPIAGVIGGINNWLDFSLLKQCAELPELGTLLLVGALPPNPSPALQALLDHPKCTAVGEQPHAEIHRWFQTLDVGLIPYVDAEFNRFRSPMRFFDHLASGVPLVATSACAQVSALDDSICVCPTAAEFVAAIQQSVALPRQDRRENRITWDDRATTLQSILEGINHA